MRDLVDEDGENRAVRSFLMLYGTLDLTIGKMKYHMESSGWHDHPRFVDFKAMHDAHLTKGAAQEWLRHLFALEKQ